MIPVDLLGRVGCSPRCYRTSELHKWSVQPVKEVVHKNRSSLILLVAVMVLVGRGAVTSLRDSQRGQAAGGEGMGSVTSAPCCFIYPVRPEAPVTPPSLTQADCW